ncbi:MAG TPA: MlaD family protein [Steroidobacteraceae bacterium]|nr:MlaD family protein [Steroidobacteraceae bacterium]
MEREANYAAVGAFVVLMITMAGLFFYWYSDGRDHRDYRRYEIYFRGSVSGLTEGSSVRYLGVEVGRVKRIRLDSRAADRVQVIVDIDSTTPVSDRTEAELTLQGLATGLLFIDLQQRALNASKEVADSAPSENYPVIVSQRSDFDLLLSSLPVVVNRVAELVTRISNVLSQDNLDKVNRLVANLDQTGAKLPGIADNLTQLLGQMRSAVEEAHQVVADAHAASSTAGPDLAAAVQKLRTAADSVASAAAGLDQFVTNNRAGVQSFVQGGLPDFENLVRDARDTVTELRQLARSLRDNPSQLLYEPANKGVEIAP